MQKTAGKRPEEGTFGG